MESELPTIMIFSLYMSIGARNKAGYINGAEKKLVSDDPRLRTWITDNWRVKSWLIDSIVKQVTRYKSVMRLIGYSDWWNFSKKPRKKIVGKSMLNATESPYVNEGSPTGHIAQTVSKGASDNMTGNPHALNSVNPTFESVVSIAKGHE
ncbi:hypothetical protein Csa_021136 [Cucumis sativus]|nr:hypothetical protein Csa_021136 [Cucumis sativus]